MSSFVYSNFNKTQLAAPISASATSLTVSTGTGANFPSPTGTQQFALVLNDQATGNVFEIVYCTAIVGDTLTIVRGQEGTTARSWLLGDYAYSGPTKGVLAGFGQLGASQTWNGNNSFSGLVYVPNSSNTGQAVSSSQFPSALGVNGYKKYPDLNSPSGFWIEQHFGITTSASGGIAFNYPIAFPNAIMSAMCCYSYTGAGGPFIAEINLGAASLSQIPASAYNLSAAYVAVGVNIWVKGY